MMNPTKRHLVSLAALALAAVACDPFPSAPGGSPRVVRVVTSGESHSASAENAAATGAVTTDYAYLDDAIYIQFNKPMDGLSIQKYPDYNPDGSPITLPPDTTTPCVPADGVAISANFPPKTTVCYAPNSVTDGGYMVVTPGEPLVYGETYTVTGTVRDYQGGPLALDVRVSVDPRPQPAASGGYAMLVDWFDSGATNYKVEQAPDVDGAPGAWATIFDAAPLLPYDTALDEQDPPLPQPPENCPDINGYGCAVCDAGLCEVIKPELVPTKSYWYRITDTIGGAPVVRKIALDAATTGGPLTATLGTVTTQATPADPPVITKGVIRVIWTRVHGASQYTVQRAPNVDGSTPAENTWQTLGVPTPPASTTWTYSDTGLVSGTRYWYRVTPTYTSGFAAVKGRAVSRLAP